MNNKPNILETSDLETYTHQEEHNCMQRTLYKSKIRIGLILSLLVALLGCNLPSLIGSSEQDPTVPGPVVAFQSPATSMAVALGEAFPVFVTASDPLGVSRIELWVGSALIMSQIAPEETAGGVTPLVLSYSLVGAEAGTHSMIARAYNSVGVLGESLAVHVTVSGVQSAASSPIDSVYIAQAGDTIESIASTTNHSIGAVQQANPGSSQLQPGQHIAIPNQPGAPPPQQQAVNPPAGAQILPPCCQINRLVQLRLLQGKAINLHRGNSFQIYFLDFNRSKTP